MRLALENAHRNGRSAIDQQLIIMIVIACLFVVGYGVFLATIYFGPNMKNYFDQK
jgi:hypothetical protein